jgi:AraC-like DNA-binding protein
MTASGTASILSARPALAALDERGVDAEPALRAAGLSRAALAVIENRLPDESLHRLWEAAAVAANDRYFGVHTAEALPAGAYDLLDYLMSSSATVGESLTRLTRYVRLLYDRSNLHLAIEPRHARLVRHVAAPAPQYDEYSLTLLLVRSRQLSATDWLPERVAFQHAAGDEGGELARVFRCPVHFSAGEIEARFAAEILALPHVRADSRLLAILMRYADSQLAALPARGDLVARACSSIVRQMARALPGLQSTASELRMPERALQRALARSGVSHSSLVDEVRRGLALKYICDHRLCIGEIAYILHFADTTGFHRAFKRWTDQTPIEYRSQLRLQTASPFHGLS